jgi:hypothetical protein
MAAFGAQSLAHAHHQLKCQPDRYCELPAPVAAGMLT